VSERPEIAERLRAQLDAWRHSVEAKIPQPNPDYVPWRLSELGSR
jgi:hypothetical protein